MTVLYEVLKDLLWFVLGRDDKVLSSQPTRVHIEESTVRNVIAPTHHVKSTPVEENRDDQQLNQPRLNLADYAQQQFVVVPNTKVWQHPYVSFDGIVKSLPFGAPVLTGEKKNRFVHVLDEKLSGWVLADNLSDFIEKITPSFEDGHTYLSDSIETVLVRKSIDDLFAGSELLLPLQSEEYVAFRIKQGNKSIEWNDSRPRLAGNWQNILKGVHGVSIGITPKTGSVMEWNGEDKGYLFYVEKVSPEEGLVVSGVGYGEEGQFSTISFKKEEWIELRPVFISIA